MVPKQSLPTRLYCLSRLPEEADDGPGLLVPSLKGLL